MLTKQEALSNVSRNLVVPDKLTTQKHAHYLGLATEMLEIYRGGKGQTREALHRNVDELFFGEANCPPKRIRAFCKLLDDEAQFDGARGDEAARLRMRVFALAAPRHPLVTEPIGLLEAREADVKQQISREIGEPWAEIEARLFGDVHALHRLQSFDGYASPSALLSRYNEAQLQAVLYDATEMRIRATADYRPIITAVKLSRLMHAATRTDTGFEFTINGPASLLRETRRYGVLMAHIIPTLLACTGWELRAQINRFRRSSHQPELLVRSGHYRSSSDTPPEFDSKLERDFMQKWGSERRDGWTMTRESEPRFLHQKAFFPDFTFQREDGAGVLMEIVGYWTPEYLSAKRDTVLQFRDEPLLLAVRHDAVDRFADLGIPLVTFKKTLSVDAVLATLPKLVSR